MVSPSLFDSYSVGGFECSMHLDLIPSTAHHRAVAKDYQWVVHQGIYAARDGVHWHPIEMSPGSCVVVSHTVCRTSAS